MELNSEVITTPPHPAATVVMLRDTDVGAPAIEVFLLKRHGLSQVLGGAFVFPGGKVDPADAQLNMQAHLDQSPHALHSGLNEPTIEPVTAASFYVAAIREAFEESGILFAQGATAHHADEATALLKQGVSFANVLAQMNLRLHSELLLPWSRWITPKVPSVTNKRFDTRFFVSAVPATQIARHDDFETTESVWLRPRVALEQYWDGQIELAPPQIMSLVSLVRHASVASVMQAARSRPPPVIEPEPFDEDGARVICYPGDERHSVRTSAMPGPSRLVFKNKRFEPVRGFESLFED
jgi:8-oxo-dGTP pyrophosphatase MutT (NUDIX family)